MVFKVRVIFLTFYPKAVKKLLFGREFKRRIAGTDAVNYYIIEFCTFVTKGGNKKNYGKKNIHFYYQINLNSNWNMCQNRDYCLSVT